MIRKRTCRRDQNPHVPALEVGERLLALGLRAVAVYRVRAHVLAVQPRQQLRRSPLLLDEDKRAAFQQGTINRPCAQQYVGKSQSCMVTSGRTFDLLQQR